MFYSIKGTLSYVDSSTTFVVVDCGGVGFKCFTSLNTVKSLPQVGSEVSLFTHLSVKEDALDLFGFLTEAELDCFKLLISVSGIGPKAAVAILSELTPDKLAISIASGDYKSLTKAQGVGKKIAERAVLELKSKMGSIASADADSIGFATSATESSGSAEAVEALVALGFSQSDAAVVVGKMSSDLSVDDMIREGLKFLSSNL